MSRRSIYYSFFFLVLFGCLSLLVTYTTFQHLPQQYKTDNEIKKILLISKILIDNFKKENHRLPSEDEYNYLVHSRTDNIHNRFNIADIIYYKKNIPKNVIEEYGPEVANGYVLSIWRGEWNEYYFSSLDEFTLPKSFKQRFNELVLPPIIATIILFISATILWFFKNKIEKKRYI